MIFHTKKTLLQITEAKNVPSQNIQQLP